MIRRFGPAALCAWTLCAAVGHAQDATEAAPPSAPAPAPAPSPAPPAPITVNQRVAELLARVALLDLRGLEAPGPDDFAAATSMLTLACRHDPLNVEINRRRVEAAFAAGDDAALMEATTAIVRADPSDTVAQLRLISARINRMQTTRERLDAYARFLGEEGKKSLDASIRSRLALDAALLAREVGDEALFVERLKAATQLDSTNKDAAALAFTYFSSRVDNARGRIELLVNLLLADPLDASAHVQMRDNLAVCGAWEQARRFHDNAAKIQRSSGPPGIDEHAESLAILWRTGSPREVMDALRKDLDIARDRQKRIFEQAGANIVGENVRPPEKIWLAAPLEQLRAAAASATGDADALAGVMQDMVAAAEDATSILSDINRRPREMTDDAAQEQIREVSVNLTIWRFLTGIDTTAAAESAQTLLAALPEEDDGERVVLEAWAAAHSSEPASAIQLVDQIEEPSTWLLAAKGVAQEKAGDKAAAAKTLQAAETADPLSPVGAWSGARARALDPAIATLDAAAAAKIARSVHAWVDTMVSYPMSFQRLFAEVAQPRAEVGEQVAVTVTLKNLSSIPLGLGSGRAMDTRMLLGPRLELIDRDLDKYVVAEVADLDRRLRLKPGEELKAVVRPEMGVVGWVLGSASAGQSRLQWRAIQGFQTMPDGRRAPGPGCLDVKTEYVQRPWLSESRAERSRLIEQVRGATDGSLNTLFIAARSHLIAASKPGADNTGVADLVGVLAEKFAGWSRNSRLAALAELPPASEVRDMEPFDAAARNERDPVVMPWVLATRVIDVDDPFIAACEQSGEPVVAQFAALHRQRLAAGSRVYALRGVTGVATGP